jgi:hypothetical protein
VIGSLCLVALSLQGAENTWQNRRDIVTIPQWLMSLAQLGYAAVGLVVVVLWWARSAALNAALLVWCLLFVAAVTLIMPAWSPEDLDLVLTFFGAGSVGAAVLGGMMWYFGPRKPAS